MERAIEASTLLDAPFDVCRTVVLREPESMIGSAAYPGMEIEAGHVRNGSTVQVPVSWRAAAFERFAPIFEGELELRPDGRGTSLDLRGHYVVPLGAAGRFGDGLIGRRVARRTAAGVLDAIAESIMERVGLAGNERGDSHGWEQVNETGTKVRDRESG